MDGTAIMQGVAVVFAAQAFGIELTMVDYLTVIGTATLASHRNGRSAKCWTGNTYDGI